MNPVKRNPTILLIEDEPDIVATLERRLRSWGFDTLAATTGPDGIRRTMLDKPDLILLDLLIPEMDGLAVLEQLRLRAIVPATPVIIVSALPVWNVQDFLGRGAAAVLQKPFDPAELRAVVSRLLGRETA